MVNGRPAAIDTMPDVKGICTWKSYTNGYLLFNLDVTNTGPIFTLNPAWCYALPLSSNISTPAVYATNPEILLTNINASIAQQERQIRRKAGWAAFGAFVDLAGALNDASSKKTSEAQKKQNQAERDYHVYNNQVRSQRDNLQLLALNDTKRDLEETLLRSNTLLPGGHIAGELRFLRMDKAQEITLVCPAGANNLRFSFSQQLR